MQVRETALHQAAKHGHRLATAFLLEHESDINAQNEVTLWHNVWLLISVVFLSEAHKVSI